MAARKQTVTEKQSGSDEKIKGLSLLFLQGKQMVFEGLDWLEFVRNLDKLDDKTKLERLAELGRKYKDPRVSIRTVKLGEPDEDGKTPLPTVTHRAVPLHAEGGGKFALGVPNLFADDGPDEYEVVDAVLIARSWTTALHNEWDAFMDERDLKTLERDINKISDEINATIPSSEEIATLWQQLPGLEKSRKDLINQEAAAFTDLSLSDEEIDKIGGRLTLITQKIDTIRKQQREWSSTNDPFEQAIAIHPQGKRLKGLNQQYENAYLEFVHRLAERYGLTEKTFTAWQEEATKLHRANAMELVASGNAPWTSGQASQALTPEQKQRRAYDSLPN